MFILSSLPLHSLGALDGFDDDVDDTGDDLQLEPPTSPAPSTPPRGVPPGEDDIASPLIGQMLVRKKINDWTSLSQLSAACWAFRLDTCKHACVVTSTACLPALEVSAVLARSLH